MKYLKYFATVLASVSLFSCGDDDVDDLLQNPNLETYVITFDDADKNAIDSLGESISWSALIDTVEYGGAGSSYLYGAGAANYYWKDEASGLWSRLNSSSYGTAFWSGGAAVSSYSCKELDEIPSSLHQLSAWTPNGEKPGYDDSDNFLVVTGYNSLYGDSRAVMSFYPKTGVVCGFYARLGVYGLSAALNDKDLKLLEGEQIIMEVEGFNADSTSTGVVSKVIAEGPATNDWVYVNLKSLGEVSYIKVDFQQKGVSPEMMMFPAYFLVDNIKVQLSEGKDAK